MLNHKASLILVEEAVGRFGHHRLRHAVPQSPPLRRHRFENRSIELTPETVASYDAIVIAPDHDSFGFRMIADHARLILDGRGRYRGASRNLVTA